MVFSLLLLTACQEKAPAEKAVPFDPATAQQMLLRNIQAMERQDLEGVKADLFPRNLNTLQTCAKSRMAHAKSATIGMADEGAATPARVTGVSLTNPAQQGGAWRADYKAQGNAAFEGSEMFVHANGRWWIKCGI